MSRKYTNKVLEMVDEGLISPQLLVEALACWCSEADMKELYERFLQENEEDENENENENDYSRRELRNRRED